MNVSADFIQADRIVRIDGLLGSDQLLAEKLYMREAVSDLFEMTLALRSKANDLQPDQVVGKLADISLDVGGGERRAWNALVVQMIAGPKVSRAMQSYQLVLRPQLWLLSQKSDCRIWQDMTSVEVCEMLLSEHGLPAPVTKGIVTQPDPQHYSVQYNETDLAYLTRRLEEDGLFYWFEHEKGKHTLHIASHPSGYLGGEDVRFAAGSTDRNHINRFETRFSYTPGVRAARDWNFQTPGTVPGADAPSLVSLPKNGSYELFEYPAVGGYGTGAASDKIDDGSVERQVKLRMQAVEADHQRVEGAGNVRSLSPGSKFTPYDQANPDAAFDEHVVLAIEHEALDASFETGGGQPEYRNRFLALPATVPATPHRATPRPRIDGTQVAIVAGPEGEEIHPDEYGRIKLWFPWDRRAAKDGTDTCWIRVMQNWAGSGWGGQIIPRIGMEVMVTYLEGDPDRPVVTGIVPNAQQRVPYDLPANKTKSVFRTNTHKGSGFNELSFEDEADQELIYMHGQKDQQIDILNDRTKTIGQDQFESVGRDKAITVGQDHTESVGRDARHTVGRDVVYNVTQTQQEKYGKDHVHYVGNIHKQDVYADHLVTIGRNMEESVRGKYVLNVNQSITNNTKHHTLMAFDKFEIKGPGGKITIDGSGITLEAAQINLKGNVSMGGSGGAQVPTLSGAANDALPLCEECLAQKGDEA
ncbi:type VI secretion system Vgr family protein [Pseudaestuariivita rosea]|uniref:type VI secretion system Vgr family protein n=1 Tax=Pseudaestuariivita rosea TaxID=2763263 RepID=UPI001ABBDBD8|nr:type VI secretion system tip protein TssI/VgrG [Pseudaestuariivita rosea]